MRLAIGLFGVLAALVAVAVATARLPLSPADVPPTDLATLAILAVNYYAVGFCALASVFAGLVMISDDWISVVGYTLSALLAAFLSSIPVAVPLLLATAALIWFVALPRRADAKAEPGPARPQRLWHPEATPPSDIAREAAPEADNRPLPQRLRPASADALHF